jgi:hypothetical protein
MQSQDTPYNAPILDYANLMRTKEPYVSWGIEQLSNIDGSPLKSDNSEKTLSKSVCFGSLKLPDTFCSVIVSTPQESLVNNLSSDKITLSEKLALEFIQKELIDYLINSSIFNDSLHSQEGANKLIQDTFEHVNIATYDFAQKLVATGMISSSALLLVKSSNNIVVGRTKQGGQVYLLRAKKIFPFFSAQGGQHLDSYLGTNVTVPIQSASVSPKPDDIIIMTNYEFDNEELNLVHEFFMEKLSATCNFNSFDFLNEINVNQNICANIFKAGQLCYPLHSENRLQ